MDRYSRMVAFLKVMLPLAALALLSTLFLLSRGIDMDGTIPFAEQEIADRTRDQQVTQPFYAGVTDAGGEIIVTASVASPEIADRPARASDLSARIRTQDGVIIDLRADLGTLQGRTERATFTGDVVLETSTGYRVESQLIEAELEAVRGRSPGPIAGQGPPGRFTAGAMEFRSETDSGEVRTLFKDGVKLIYDPKRFER